MVGGNPFSYASFISARKADWKRAFLLDDTKLFIFLTNFFSQILLFLRGRFPK